MFTGIIQATAHITAIDDHDGLRTLTLNFPTGFCNGLTIGASVCTDGVCLTVVSRPSPEQATFDVMQQTLSITTLGHYGIGARVNVERAAREGAEIGGHPLSGHVDCTVPLLAITHDGGNCRMRFGVPTTYRPYIFAKGYIAINGASLTIATADRQAGWFDVCLIPETRRVTTLDEKKIGDHLNIEIDRNTQVIVDTVRATVRDFMQETSGK